VRSGPSMVSAARLLVGAVLVGGLTACGAAEDSAAGVAVPDPDAAVSAPAAVNAPRATEEVAPPATDEAQEDEPATGRRVTIAVAGDVVPHGAVIRRAAEYGAATGRPYDFRPMFAEVAPILQAADLAICNLETPVAADHAEVREAGFPLFNAPRELVEALVGAGFDACSTANNHASDVGSTGVVSTLDVLDEVGLTGAGTGRTPEEAAAPRLHTVRGVTIAHLAATGWINVALPEDRAWMVELIDVERLVGQARAARDAGAEIVVVSLHHGVEYQRQPSDGQRARADALLTSGAVDLVLGHHVHVVQPIDRVGDGVAVHGLGNLLSNQQAELTGAETEDGVIVLLEFGQAGATDRFQLSHVAYVPTWVDRDRHVIVDVGAALESPSLDPERHATLVGSWERTVAGITLDGADTWGVEPTTGTTWFQDRGRQAPAEQLVRSGEPGGSARDPRVLARR
jgi:poly-gamma-glutamate capsule biosynthesis protein CapA/YwtB (metallophosphatase superfamily)